MHKLILTVFLLSALKGKTQESSVMSGARLQSFQSVHSAGLSSTNKHVPNKLPRQDSSALVKIWRAGLSGASFLNGRHVPFWMRSRVNGCVPLSGVSFSLTGAVEKNYRLLPNRLFDWGAGLEIRADIGNRARAILPEAYLKGRIWYFELKAGRDRETMGLTGDTSLTSGSFAVSGNALGIPKLELSIPEYAPLFGGKLFAFKGNFAYGWMGKGALNRTVYTYDGQIYFHQKSLYGRLGKPSWRLKVYGGINHQGMWGWDRQTMGARYDLSNWKAFEYIVLGEVYRGSKLGNQLGSVDAGLSYAWKNVLVLGYHQFIYDVGALFHLANLLDGITGVCFTNQKATASSIKWSKLLIEVVYTKNQAGELWSKPTPSGDENYYNNWGKGWSYKGLGLGTPFITPAYTTRQDLPNDPLDYFNNNRVLVFHTAMKGSVKRWLVTSKFSYSRNWGTYGTSTIGHSLGRDFFPPHSGTFKEVGQFSAYLAADKKIKSGWTLGVEAAVDAGGLFENSVGAVVKVSRMFR